jgi:hypothetical protein
MAPYDAQQALDDLLDDSRLPHPVRLRDVILRTQLDPDTALGINRRFQDYLAHYGETEQLARTILGELLLHAPKAS